MVGTISSALDIKELGFSRVILHKRHHIDILVFSKVARFRAFKPRRRWWRWRAPPASVAQLRLGGHQTALSTMPLANLAMVFPVQGAIRSRSRIFFGPMGSASTMLFQGFRPVISSMCRRTGGGAKPSVGIITPGRQWGKYPPRLLILISSLNISSRVVRPGHRHRSSYPATPFSLRLYGHLLPNNPLIDPGQDSPGARGATFRKAGQQHRLKSRWRAAKIHPGGSQVDDNGPWAKSFSVEASSTGAGTVLKTKSNLGACRAISFI